MATKTKVANPEKILNDCNDNIIKHYNYLCTTFDQVYSWH
jgi:hypothetical protein